MRIIINYLVDCLYKSKIAPGFLEETKPSQVAYIDDCSEWKRFSTTKSPIRLTYVVSLLVVILALAVPCLASAELLEEDRLIDIIYQKQVELNIASEAVNRISFSNERVIKIIGNVSGFNNVLSDNGSDLFVTTKLPVGSKIDFSALLSSGDIIDFALRVTNSKTPYLVKLKFFRNVPSHYKSEAIKMIEAMSAGSINKYYVQGVNNPIIIPAKAEVKIIAQDSYRFGNLYGTSLTLHNTNRFAACEVTLDDLAASLNGIVAAYIDHQLLPPNGKTRGYIVFKRVGE